MNPAEQITARIVTTAQLRQLPPPTPLIGDLIYMDSLAMLYGPSGVGKTHVALDVAAAVRCLPFWHGAQVLNGRVLYVIAESASGVGQRTIAWEQHNGAEPDIEWLPMAINLYSPTWASALAEVVNDRAPVLVVVDTLARSMPGADENSAQDIGVVVAHLDQIRRAAGSCVLVVHHAGKDIGKGARGNSALRAAMNTELEVAGTENQIVLKVTKQKDAREAPPLRFNLTPIAGTGSVVITQGSTDADALPETMFETLAALRAIDIPEGVSATAWRAACDDINERTFYRHRSALTKHGYAINVSTTTQPKYRPADEDEVAA